MRHPDPAEPSAPETSATPRPDAAEIAPIPTLEQALTPTPSGPGEWSLALHGAFSNGPESADPGIGTPFGGLLAATAGQVMQTGLEIRPPMRSLSVQYVAAPRFAVPLLLTPRIVRAGRLMAFAQAEARQNGRVTHRASATFGQDDGDGILEPLHRRPPHYGDLELTPRRPGLLDPHFSRTVEYRFDGPPRTNGVNVGKAPVERVWMRCADGLPLTRVRLAYLLDAAYPPAWTVLPRPVAMATLDLRCDFIVDPTPEIAPEGWAFFEFRMLDLGRGWTLDDAVAVGVDGTPLAVSRQRRRYIAERSPA